MARTEVSLPTSNLGEYDWVAMLVTVANGKTTHFWGEVYDVRPLDDGTVEYRLYLLPYDGRELVFRTTGGTEPTLVSLPYYEEANFEIGPDGARTGITIDEVLALERIADNSLPPIEQRDYETEPSTGCAQTVAQ